MDNFTKCRSIVLDESLDGQLLTIEADVSVRKEGPGGFWLQATDDSGKALVWSKEKLEGRFELYGKVYKGYLVLMKYTAEKKFDTCTVPQIFEEKCDYKVVDEGMAEGAPKSPAALQPESKGLFQAEEKTPAQVFDEPSDKPDDNPFEETPFAEETFNPSRGFPIETLAESKSHLISLGVVCISSLALGAGAYSLSLTYPPQMQSPIFLMLPFLSIFLGLAAYFAIMALDQKFVGLFGFGGHADFLGKIWHVFLPYILSAFILLFISPEYVQTGMSLQYLFALQKAFMLALIPIGLGVGYHLVIINTEDDLDLKQVLAFGASPLVLFVPLFMLYYLVTSTIGA